MKAWYQSLSILKINKTFVYLTWSLTKLQAEYQTLLAERNNAWVLFSIIARLISAVVHCHVFLFAVAETAHGENYYVWANLAPPEWSAGAVCMLPCQPPRASGQTGNHIQSLSAPKHIEWKKNTPVSAKYKYVESLVELTWTPVDAADRMVLCSIW